MRKKPLAIVQSRVGSTRLPGKALLEINGLALSEQVVRRAQAGAGRVVLALPDSDADDKLAAAAQNWPCEIVRGSEDDVLGRFYKVIEQYPDADPIVRVTGDNPLIAIGLMRENIQDLMNSSADWAAYNYQPLGVGTAVFRRESLVRAFKEASSERDREHVTLWIKKHPKMQALRRPAPLPYRAPGLRLTVDTAEDLELFRKIYGEFPAAGWRLKVPDVIDYLAKNPQLVKINSGVKQKVYSSKQTIVYLLNRGGKWGHGHWHRCCQIARRFKSENAKSYKNYFLLGSDGAETLQAPKTVDILAEKAAPFAEEQLPAWQIRSGAELIILDHKYTDSDTVIKLKERGCRVVGIEDRGTGRSEMDLVIDPNIYPDTIVDDRVSEEKQCYGPRFALVDPRFAACRPETVSGDLKKVGLCFGGTDPAGVTDRFVRSVVVDYPQVEFHLFGSTRNKKLPGNLICRGNVADPAAEFSKLDLMIISGGVLKFEVACLQLPAIIIPQHDEQYENSKLFIEKNKISWPLLEHSPPTRELRNVFERAMTSGTRKNWAESVRGVVDGQGISRLVKKITGDLYP
ncbi:MAG: cytidylyltransferase domain-containing protein [bacterium]